MKYLLRLVNRHAAYAVASWRVSMMYKGNFWMQILGFALLLVIQVSLWSHLESATLSKKQVEAAIRYLVATQLTALLLSGDAAIRFLSERVKTGQILVDLLRPLRLFFLTFAHQAGVHFSALLFVILPNLVFAVAILDVHFDQVTTNQWLVFLATLVFSYLLAFFLGYLIGIFSLWLGNIWGIKEFYDAFAIIMGGTLVPISFYPSWLKEIAQWFPFQIIYYTPAAYLAGFPTMVENPLLLQGIWGMILLIVNIGITKVAMKKAVLQGG